MTRFKRTTFHHNDIMSARTRRCFNMRCALVLVTVVSCGLLVMIGRAVQISAKDGPLVQTLQSSAGSDPQAPSWTGRLLPSPNISLPSWEGYGRRDPPAAGPSYKGPNGGALLIPSDSELAKMNEQQMEALYWKYINTIQVLCRNQTRLGSFKDGGKEICIDNEYLPGKPCLVYSFGSNFQFDFEQAVINSFGCDVHTFDPSLNLRQKGKTVPGNVHFQLKGLDGKDHKNSKNWEMRTLDTIMKELGHENKVIDFLKIDIEGGEWTALPHMFQMGTLQRAKQLQIEVHFGRTGLRGRPGWGGVNSIDQLKVLRELYNQGFLIFMREHNLYSLTAFKSEYNNMWTNVNEISLINMKYRKS